MCIKDWNVILETPGKQLNLVLTLGVISIIILGVANGLEKMTPSAVYCCKLTLVVVKGIAVFLVFYFFAYSIILTKKLVDKHYK